MAHRPGMTNEDYNAWLKRRRRERSGKKVKLNKNYSSWAQVAEDLYGDQRMMFELQAANRGISRWHAGMTIKRPGQIETPRISHEQMARARGEWSGGMPTSDYINALAGFNPDLANRVAGRYGVTGVGGAAPVLPALPGAAGAATAPSSPQPTREGLVPRQAPIPRKPAAVFHGDYNDMGRVWGVFFGKPAAPIPASQGGIPQELRGFNARPGAAGTGMQRAQQARQGATFGAKTMQKGGYAKGGGPLMTSQQISAGLPPQRQAAYEGLLSNERAVSQAMMTPGRERAQQARQGAGFLQRGDIGQEQKTFEGGWASAADALEGYFTRYPEMRQSQMRQVADEFIVGIPGLAEALATDDMTFIQANMNEEQIGTLIALDMWKPPTATPVASSNYAPVESKYAYGGGGGRGSRGFGRGGGGYGGYKPVDYGRALYLGLVNWRI